MRSSALGLCFVLLVMARGASAQETLAVLPTELGGGRVETADLSAALLRQGVSLAPPRRTGLAIQARYALPSGLSTAVIAALAEQGETAYFEMRYDDAVEGLSTREWSAAERAVVDMASDPELGAAVRRGMMARARAQYYSERLEAADATFGNLVRLFPAWLPTTELYQPEIVERYTALRADSLQAAQTLTVEAPEEDCAIALNGEVVAQSRQATVAVLEGAYAVRVSCGRQTSRIHAVEVPATATLVVDPSFDQRFDPSLVALAPASDAADDLARLAAWGRAFADVSGAHRVILAGLTAADELELVLVEAGVGTVGAAVRCPRVDGSHPVDEAVTALMGGEVGPHVRAARDGSFGGVEPGSSSAAPWVAFGIAGAGLIAGVVFVLVEDGAYSHYQACQGDPGCATTGALGEHQSDSETAGVLATVGFSVAAAGAVVGAILLVLEESAGETAPEPAETAWNATLRPALLPEGAGLEIGGRF